MPRSEKSMFHDWKERKNIITIVYFPNAVYGFHSRPNINGIRSHVDIKQFVWFYCSKLNHSIHRVANILSEHDDIRKKKRERENRGLDSYIFWLVLKVIVLESAAVVVVLLLLCCCAAAANRIIIIVTAMIIMIMIIRVKIRKHDTMLMIIVITIIIFF